MWGRRRIGEKKDYQTINRAASMWRDGGSQSTEPRRDKQPVKVLYANMFASA